MSREAVIAALPWKQPQSVYDSDGPSSTDPVEFQINGARLRVTLTDAIALNTGRGRYRVECLTCGWLIHPATTGTTTRCASHIFEEHK